MMSQVQSQENICCQSNQKTELLEERFLARESERVLPNHRKERMMEPGNGSSLPGSSVRYMHYQLIKRSETLGSSLKKLFNLPKCQIILPIYNLACSLPRVTVIIHAESFPNDNALYICDPYYCYHGQFNLENQFLRLSESNLTQIFF